MVLGSSTGHLAASAAALLVVWAAFIATVAPFCGTSQPSMTLTAFVLWAVETTLLTATACTEPGIVPSRRPTAYPHLAVPLPPEQPLLSPGRGRKVSSRYCHTCLINRPHRARHCRLCDHCVDTFDHHCPWTGTCIGRRNYPPFILFVASIVVGAAFLLAATLTVLLGWVQGRPTDAPYLRAGAIVVATATALLVLFLVGALLLFHLYLCHHRLTTSEFLRGGGSVRAPPQPQPRSLSLSQPPQVEPRGGAIQVVASLACFCCRYSLLAQSAAPTPALPPHSGHGAEPGPGALAGPEVGAGGCCCPSTALLPMWGEYGGEEDVRHYFGGDEEEVEEEEGWGGDDVVSGGE